MAVLVATGVAYGPLRPPAARAAAGDVDRTFGADGNVVTPMSDGDDALLDVVVQPDGKIVAVGTVRWGPASPLPESDMGIVRYHPDGSPDETFGSGGRVTPNLVADGAFGVALQEDGRIVVAGEAAGDFAVLRYLPDGSPDATFGDAGVVRTDVVNQSDRADDVAIQDDGRIVVAGSAGAYFAVVRYFPDGTLDATFDGDGRALALFRTPESAQGHALELLPDGRIVVAGETFLTYNEDNDFALARFNADGSLDTSFSGDGKVTTAISGGVDQGWDVAVQPDGSVVVAGGGHESSTARYDFSLARYTPDGALDPTFGADGIVSAPIGSGSSSASAVVVQPDGNIVAAGHAHVVRFLPDGTLDRRFGTGGVRTIDLGSPGQPLGLYLYGVVQQEDGRLVAVGETLGPQPSGQDYALVRLDGDPAVSVSDAIVREGDSGRTTATFELSLSSAAGADGVSVAYTTADRSAVAGRDYDARSGVAVIPPGERSTEVLVGVRGDAVDESTEAFSLQLSSPVNGAILDGTATGTIVDDEPLVIDHFAGGPELVDTLVIDAPDADVRLHELCTDPRTLPCLDLAAADPAGPNPRTVQGVTFQAFDHNDDAASSTAVAGTGAHRGLVAGARLVVRFPSGVPAAELTLVRTDDAYESTASVTAFFTSGRMAARETIAASADQTERLRLPAVPARQVAQQPFAVAAAGDFLYVADPANHLVRFLDPAPDDPCPCESVFAGNGSLGSSGDGSEALLTQLRGPYAVAPVASSRTVVPEMYIADTYGHRVVLASVESAAEGPRTVLRVVAGTGAHGFAGDGGPAASAQLNSPFGVARDTARGITYVADTLNHRVRAIGGDGIIRTVAGTGAAGYGGDGGPATSALLNEPRGLAVDRDGILYIADTSNHSVRRLDPGAGVITTVAGSGRPGAGGDGGPAVRAELRAPSGVGLDDASPPNLFIADTVNHRIRALRGTDGTITTVAGTGEAGFGGDGGSPLQARLDSPFGVAVRANGDVVIADTLNQRVRVVTRAAGTAGTTRVITTLAGNGTASLADDNLRRAEREQFGGASALVAGLGGGRGARQPWTIVADPFNHAVRLVDEQGDVVTLAGTGAPGRSGDGGPAIRAALSSPFGVAALRKGRPDTVYVADTFNNVVRRIDRLLDEDGDWQPEGARITTVVGTGSAGFGGDGGPAAAAELGYPTGVAVDGAGNLYIADAHNARIRKVDPGGTITTIAGKGTLGSSGDGGPATNAELYFPYSVAVDEATPANVYVGDTFNHRARRIDGDDGTITTVAGNGTAGAGGDGGPATAASLDRPWGLGLDPGPSPRVVVADTGNNRIRVVDGSGEISTVAALGDAGRQGDLGPSVDALVSGPRGVASVAPDVLAIVADSFSNRLRRLARAYSEPVPTTATFTLSSLDLGCIVTCPEPTPVSVSNEGEGAALAVQRVQVLGPNAADFRVTGDGCRRRTLPQGGSCAIRIEFRPTLASFAPELGCPDDRPCRFGVLRLVTNGADSVVDVPLEGRVLVPECLGRRATAIGSHGPDMLLGTDGADVVVAGDGNDSIQAAAGDDVVCAGPGDDGVDAPGRTVNGGPGADLIFGGPGDDFLEGDADDDVVLGDDGDDYLDGGVGGCCAELPNGGQDALSGGRGNDILWSGDFGRASLHGGPGNDELNGLTGNDTLVGGSGDDVGKAGDGNDVVRMDDGISGNDTADAGLDEDSCRRDEPDDVETNCADLLDDRIAFTTGRDGNLEIYTMIPFGEHATWEAPRNDSADPSDDSMPSWSSTGSALAFTSLRAGNPEIFRVNLLGLPDPRNLTAHPAPDGEPAWAPGGAGRVAFSSERGGNVDIYTVADDGTGQTVRLTTDPGRDESPHWAWNGRITFSSDRAGNFDIFSMVDNGTQQRRLTTDPAADTQPALSPDGTKIAFVRAGQAGGIYVMNADGSGQRRLIADVTAHQPSWSSDGRRMLFTSRRNGNDEVYVMAAAGFGQSRLTHNPAVDTHARWPIRFTGPL